MKKKLFFISFFLGFIFFYKVFVDDSHCENSFIDISLIDSVKLALSNNPEIKIKELDVEYHKNNISIIKSKFDLVIENNLSQKLTQTPNTDFENYYSQDKKTTIDNLKFSGNLSKLFSAGEKASASIEISKLKNRETGVNIPSANRSSFNFSIIKPLLKDAGKFYNTGDIAVSQFNIDIAELELIYQASYSAYTVVCNYWQLASLKKQLIILENSEKRTRDMIQKTKKLIDADELPKSEMIQMQAALENKISQKNSCEASIINSLNNLALNIGVTIEQISLVKNIADNIELIEIPKDFLSKLSNYIQLAKKHRADYTAINEKNFERSISIKISNLISIIDKCVNELNHLNESFKFYELSLENEKLKFIQGNSTLLNITTCEDRLTSSMISRLNVLEKLADYIAQLRFETGTISEYSAGKFNISINSLTKLP